MKHDAKLITPSELTMAFIWLLIKLSSNPLHESSSEVASNNFAFIAIPLVCFKLFL